MPKKAIPEALIIFYFRIIKLNSVVIQMSTNTTLQSFVKLCYLFSSINSGVT